MTNSTGMCGTWDASVPAKAFKSFTTQSGQRVDTCCSPCGNVAGGHDHYGQGYRHGNKDGWIVVVHYEHHAGEHTRGEVGCSASNPQAQQTDPRALAQNEAQHVAPVRSQGHAYADLMSTLDDAVRDEPIDPDCRQQQRQSGENTKQLATELLRRHRAFQQIGHWMQPINRFTRRPFLYRLTPC